MGCHRFQALQRDLPQRLTRRVQEIGVGAFTPSPHTPTQLVQLAQPVILGVINNEGVCVRNIQACLDDCGAYQHIEAAFPKIYNNLLQPGLAHTPVGGGDARLRH